MKSFFESTPCIRVIPDEKQFTTVGLTYIHKFEGGRYLLIFSYKNQTWNLHLQGVSKLRSHLQRLGKNRIMEMISQRDHFDCHEAKKVLLRLATEDYKRNVLIRVEFIDIINELSSIKDENIKTFDGFKTIIPLAAPTVFKKYDLNKMNLYTFPPLLEEFFKRCWKGIITSLMKEEKKQAETLTQAI